MATKISELPDEGFVLEGDAIPMVRGGVTSRATISPVLDRSHWQGNAAGNVAPTLIVGVGAPVEAVIPWVTGSQVDFSQVGSQFTYNGAAARTFAMHLTASFMRGGGASTFDECVIDITVNGTPVAATPTVGVNNNRNKSASVSWYLVLSPSDVVTIRATNNSLANDVIIADASFNILNMGIA